MEACTKNWNKIICELKVFESVLRLFSFFKKKATFRKYIFAIPLVKYTNTTFFIWLNIYSLKYFGHDF